MSTKLVTVSGVWIDLYQPTAADIRFEDIAEHLAKETRYNGATPGTVYSVAEHLVRAADYALAFVSSDDSPGWMWKSVDRTRAAAYVLCHDFHEAYLKDDTTPKKRTLDLVAEEFGVAAGAIIDAYGRLVDRHDAAIHERAGLAWPPKEQEQVLVKAIDRRMLVTEWQQLLPGQQLPDVYQGIKPFPIEIDPWPWENARDALLARMQRLLPVFQRKVAA